MVTVLRVRVCVSSVCVWHHQCVPVGRGGGVWVLSGRVNGVDVRVYMLVTVSVPVCRACVCVYMRVCVCVCAYWVSLLKAHSPANRTGSPQAFISSNLTKLHNLSI